MKSHILWLYALLALVSVALIVVGALYIDNKAELAAGVDSVATEPVRQLFQQIDTDKDGALSEREFAQHVNRQVKQNQARQQILKTLQAQFRDRDANRDGYINPEEYSELLVVKQLAAKAPPLSASDTNADGKLSFREYVAFREKLATATSP